MKKLLLLIPFLFLSCDNFLEPQKGESKEPLAKLLYTFNYSQYNHPSDKSKYYIKITWSDMWGPYQWYDYLVTEDCPYTTVQRGDIDEYSNMYAVYRGAGTSTKTFKLDKSDFKYEVDSKRAYGDAKVPFDLRINRVSVNLELINSGDLDLDNRVKIKSLTVTINNPPKLTSTPNPNAYTTVSYTLKTYRTFGLQEFQLYYKHGTTWKYAISSKHINIPASWSVDTYSKTNISASGTLHSYLESHDTVLFAIRGKDDGDVTKVHTEKTYFWGL